MPTNFPDHFLLYTLHALLVLVYFYRAVRQLRALISGKVEKAISGLRNLDEESLKKYNVKKAVKIQCVLYILFALLSLSVLLYAILSQISSSSYLMLLIVFQLALIILTSPLALYLSKKPTNIS